MRLEPGGTTLYPVAKFIDMDGEGPANARLGALAPDQARTLGQVAEELTSIHAGIEQHRATSLCESPGLKLTAERTLRLLDQVRQTLKGLTPPEKSR